MTTEQGTQTFVDVGVDASATTAVEGGRIRLFRPTVVRAALRMGVVFGFFTAPFVLIYLIDSVIRIGNWGYLGIFFVQMMNSATILLPAPGHVFTFTIANSLNPLIIGVIGGLGAGIGELTGYLLGASGRHVLTSGRWYAGFDTIANRWASPAIFTIAALPLPFDVAGVWAGAARYPVWKFLALVTAGKVIKVTLIAGAGYYSVPYLLRLATWAESFG